VSLIAMQLTDASTCRSRRKGELHAGRIFGVARGSRIPAHRNGLVRRTRREGRRDRPQAVSAKPSGRARSGRSGDDAQQQAVDEIVGEVRKNGEGSSDQGNRAGSMRSGAAQLPLRTKRDRRSAIVDGAGQRRLGKRVVVMCRLRHGLRVMHHRQHARTLFCLGAADDLEVLIIGHEAASRALLRVPDDRPVRAEDGLQSLTANLHGRAPHPGGRWLHASLSIMPDDLQIPVRDVEAILSIILIDMGEDRAEGHCRCRRPAMTATPVSKSFRAVVKE